MTRIGKILLISKGSQPICIVYFLSLILFGCHNGIQQNSVKMIWKETTVAYAYSTIYFNGEAVEVFKVQVFNNTTKSFNVKYYNHSRSNSNFYLKINNDTLQLKVMEHIHSTWNIAAHSSDSVVILGTGNLVFRYKNISNYFNHYWGDLNKAKLFYMPNDSTTNTDSVIVVSKDDLYQTKLDNLKEIGIP